MYITRSGDDTKSCTQLKLLVSDSFVRVQDSSLTINGCTFLGSKQAVKIMIRTSMVSSIRITDLTFLKNRSCISVLVNSRKSPTQNTQIIFKLKNSYFDDDTCMMRHVSLLLDYPTMNGL